MSLNLTDVGYTDVASTNVASTDMASSSEAMLASTTGIPNLTDVGYTDVASSEVILAAIAIPIGSLNTLITLFIVIGVIKYSIKGDLESKVIKQRKVIINNHPNF